MPDVSTAVILLTLRAFLRAEGTSTAPDTSEKILRPGVKSVKGHPDVNSEGLGPKRRREEKGADFVILICNGVLLRKINNGTPRADWRS